MFKRVLLSLAILVAIMAFPYPVQACPMCKDAVESNPKLAAMYNWSILLLVGLPFVLVGSIGLQAARSLNPTAYRQFKQRAREFLWPRGWLYLASGTAALALLFYLTTPPDPMTRLRFPYPALDSQPILNAASPLASLEDRVVVVTFFASWCGPCVEQVNDLSQLQAEFDAGEVTFLAVSAFEDYTTPPGIPHLHADGTLEFHSGAPDLPTFLQTNHVTFPVVINTPGLSKAFGNVSRVPTTFVFDPAGRVAKWYVNETRGSFVRPSLEALRQDIRGALACGRQTIALVRQACLALYSGH